MKMDHNYDPWRGRAYITEYAEILSQYTTDWVVRLEVSILRVMGSYPSQWASMYVLVNPNPYGTG